jgi:hypothetical protein
LLTMSKDESAPAIWHTLLRYPVSRCLAGGASPHRLAPDARQVARVVKGSGL